MSRPIKFRVWNGNSMFDPIEYLSNQITESALDLYRGKNSFYDEDEAFDFGEVIVANLNSYFTGEYQRYVYAPDEFTGKMVQQWKNFKSNYILMQFTGLTDRNGKEIYEGDIISHNNGEHLCKIMFLNGSFKQEYFKGSESGIIRYISHSAKYCEVIGNLYQTPNLLKP
jgi:uncharacterized phage protein (TIGR01671 family)